MQVRSITESDEQRGVLVSIRRALPAVAGSVTTLRAEVAELVDASGAGERLLTDVKLAVSEAVTNVVMHAYIGTERIGEVRLIALMYRDRVEITVSDDGRGMMPRLDSPGLGVGLPFIAQASDTLDIGPGDSGGTVLRMVFALQSSTS